MPIQAPSLAGLELHQPWQSKRSASSDGVPSTVHQRIILLLPNPLQLLRQLLKMRLIKQMIHKILHRLLFICFVEDVIGAVIAFDAGFVRADVGVVAPVGVC